MKVSEDFDGLVDVKCRNATLLQDTHAFAERVIDKDGVCVRDELRLGLSFVHFRD